MRTRRSNKNKHFYDLDAEADENANVEFARLSRREQRQEEGDADFDASAARGAKGKDTVGSAEEQDEPMPDAVSDDDDENSEDDFSDDSIVGGLGPGQPRSGASAARKSTSANAEPVWGQRSSPHEIPAYPLDARIATRVQTGPLHRYARFAVMRDHMYGPDPRGPRLALEMRDRWAADPVLPPGHAPDVESGVLPSPWVAGGFEERQRTLAAEWLARLRRERPDAQRSRVVPAKNGRRLVPQTDGELRLYLGPHDEQREVEIPEDGGFVVGDLGLPVQGEEPPRGWIVDAGGVILGIGFAPSHRETSQVLAVAVVPHSDQAPKTEKKETSDEDRRSGCIKLYEFTADKDRHNKHCPSRVPPKFIAALCFNWGRPRRLQWCPVPFTTPGVRGLLAILCSDGLVHVIEVPRINDKNSTTEYRWIDSPLATLGFLNEYKVEATCFAWAGINNLVLGHTDGSITLWSIHPARLVLRHFVHTSYVLDISTGYPSQPTLVASTPVGGCPALVDLRRPSQERTYVPVPSLAFQRDMMAWSDHLQGWLVLHPSPGPGNTAVGFLQMRAFSQPRPMFTGTSPPTCVAIGAVHPYALVGCADGSLWAFSAIGKLLRERKTRGFKMCVFEHEFKPAEDLGLGAAGSDGSGARVATENRDAAAKPLVRGGVRILQGFLPEINSNPRAEKLTLDNLKRSSAAKKKKTPAKKGKKKQTAGEGGADMEDNDDGDEEDDEGDAADIFALKKKRMIINEPLTRVTAVTWNPNIDFGWWAAVAMGSGVIRVMDLGVD